MTLVLSTTNMNALYLWVHDRYHFVLANARVYGSDIIDIKFGKEWNPNRISYEVFPIETTFIDEENEHCLTPDEIADESIPQCLDKFSDSLLNCTLPWRSKITGQNLPLCSNPWDYDSYLHNQAPSDPVSIRNIAKCSPGCRRYSYSTKVYSRWVKKSEPGVLHLRLFYQQYDVPVRELVYAYDRWNLVSDIGGYLGLLLGYSLLAFYDSLILILRYIMKLFARRRFGRNEELLENK